MPFVSKAQNRKCWALKTKGQNGSWDCSEWASATSYDHLPEKEKQSQLSVINLLGAEAAEFAKSAVSLSQFKGVANASRGLLSRMFSGARSVAPASVPRPVPRGIPMATPAPAIPRPPGLPASATPVMGGGSIAGGEYWPSATPRPPRPQSARPVAAPPTPAP